MTLYDLLDIPKNATDKEIKLAYKKQAKKYHPDLNKSNDDMFVRINNAYSILSNPIQKQKYDTMLSTSTEKTFEIFAKGKANPDTYYSDSDLWHQSFMNNNKITREWDFNVDNQSYNKFDDHDTYQDWSNNNYSNAPRKQKNLESFLDYDISLLFHMLFKNEKININFINRLAFREDFVNSNLPSQDIINFFKFKYNYEKWLNLKNYMNIRLVLEATEIEVRAGLEIKSPLNLRVIEPNNFYGLWYEKTKNYILNIPPKVKNGEIMEFFGKGHKALGWEGDLIVVIKIVPKVTQRIRFLDNYSTNQWVLWFGEN
ncbi:J domain-containing protein [Mycoplasmoides pirum]|uniref:J domain-containing protein n=1 Tax=Mycoplasmoides pirum TaxID=2122 RepID=UPI00069638DB|nr:J domain-containing protein [Mycoplasmoides pirum]